MSGAPPTPPNVPSVYRRGDLTEEQLLEISRQQFNDIDERKRKWYDINAKRLSILEAHANKIASRNPDFRSPQTIKLSQYEADLDYVLATLIPTSRSEDLRFTTRDLALLVMDKNGVYICQYVNEIRSQVSDVTSYVDSSSLRSRHGYKNLAPIQLTPGTFRRNCMAINQEDFISILNPFPGGDTRPGILEKIFSRLKCTKQDFFNLDYFFVPHHQGPYVQGGLHWVLAGISPTQKFLFVIDTGPGGHHVELMVILAIIQHEMRPKNGFGGQMQDWPVYQQWDNRVDPPAPEYLKTDGSPDGPYQKDTWNCGVFTLTSAFCLAFGFNLLCYKQEDLDPLKRPRIAAEMKNGGFHGDYVYDMVDTVQGALKMYPLNPDKIMPPPKLPDPDPIPSFLDFTIGDSRGDQGRENDDGEGHVGNDDNGTRPATFVSSSERNNTDDDDNSGEDSLSDQENKAIPKLDLTKYGYVDIAEDGTLIFPADDTSPENPQNISNVGILSGDPGDAGRLSLGSSTVLKPKSRNNLILPRQTLPQPSTSYERFLPPTWATPPPVPIDPTVSFHPGRNYYNGFIRLPTGVSYFTEGCHRTRWIYDLTQPIDLTDIERRMYPPQFSPKQFRCYGFIYGDQHYPPRNQVPTETLWWLETGHHLFSIPLKLIRFWSEGLLGGPLFCDWLVNCVRAWFAMYNGERVRPSPILVPGFKEWDRVFGFDVENDELEDGEEWFCSCHRPKQPPEKEEAAWFDECGHYRESTSTG